jgi:putative ATP-binding cassette transporter
MPTSRKPAITGRRLVRALWRLLRIYWKSPDAKWGWLLLALAIALELGTVYGNLLLADAERQVMDALERKQAAPFFSATFLFLAISLGFVLVSAYRIYVRQVLEIRWRRGVTADYLQRWMGPGAYAQARLHGAEVDNPDQRISEDVREFVASALGLSLSLLSALATIVSFGGLLWVLSRHFVFPFASAALRVPGLMLWVAVGYALVSTWLTHLVGRRLVPINFDRLRFEADFRYGLVRFRDSVEEVALSHGQTTERRGALRRFGNVIENWWQLIRAQRSLNIVTTSIGQANGLVPLLVAAPAYIAGHLTLGSVVQIRFAYGQVSGALNWFVYAYQEIARWRANAERLDGFAAAMAATARDLERAGVEVAPAEGGALRLADLRLVDPSGNVLFEHANATAEPGARVAITGPSGSGKTFLLRAMAGIWPFGSGRIELPTRARMLFVSQRPYIPVASLRAAVSYPAPEGQFTDPRIRDALGLLGLADLATRLDDVDTWDQVLSGHEQQRLAMARALLNEPEWLFLDEATSELDEPTEKRIYEILAERLPHTAVISIAKRPAVEAFHGGHWTLAPRDGGPSALQVA